LLEYLEDRPTAYLDEMQFFLFDEFEIECDLSTVYRALQRQRWSRKVVKARAAERSEILREQWRVTQRHYHADQLIFLDESAAHERTGDWKYGWGPLGGEVGVERSIKRSKRWSVLPAMTVNGYIEYIKWQGSINAPIFEWFLEEKVLPLTTPYPGRYSVLVLDNARIHKSERVEELCRQHGVLLSWLLPYSPDYNPIEYTFHDLKMWLRRHHQMEAMFESFEAFLDHAIQETLGAHAAKYFKRCGYLE